MRKKCKNVKALFALWPLESCAACIMLFPELECVRVDILDVSCSAGRPPPPAASAGMQAASRLMLRLTAAVMQLSLQKGVCSPAHELTHIAGKLLPSSQSSQSAAPGLDGCQDRVGPDSGCGQQDYKPQMYVEISVWFVLFCNILHKGRTVSGHSDPHFQFLNICK